MLMRLRNLFIFTVLPIAVFGSFLAVGEESLYAAEAPLKIVATQALFADLAKQVGGERVEVRSIASAKFNVHFIQPKPSDVRSVAKADLVVFAGLDLEAWFDPLVEAAGKPQFFRGGEKCLDLSHGIPLLKVPAGAVSRAQGDIHLFGNPHYHMNPENLKIMAGTILEKLKEIDPGSAAYYDRNTADFLSRLDEKITEWKKLCAHCAGQEIISHHDDIVYFVDFLKLKDDQFLEPKPGIPPTPKHLEFLENYVKEKKIRAIVLPTFYSRDAADRLASRVGAKVVMLCQNVGEAAGTEDVFGFFDHNVRRISEVLL